MARNGKRPLILDGEPTQRTNQGLEIPIVKTKDFDRLLKSAATKKSPPKRRKKSPRK